jgi:hypothetical protein
MIRKILTSSLIALVGIGGFFVSFEKEETGNIAVTGINIVSASGGTAEGVAPAPKPNEGDTEVKKMLNNLVAWLNIILGVITVIVSPAVMLAGWLMSPDWTSGDLFGLRDVMHSLWVTVSNILYFVYAVLLIIIALATMFNQEKFGYKVMLPKLALGIILVPFTWWFVQWTISLAAVVTASVISIPVDTIKLKDSSNPDNWANKYVIPKNIIIADSNNEPTSSATEESVRSCADGTDSSKCMRPSEFLQKSSWMYGYMIVYAYWVFKLWEIKDIKTGTDVIKSIWQIIHQGVIWAIMFVVFGILTIALVFMLMMRAIKLWFYAIFSPLFTLHFVVGKDLLGDKLDDFSLKEFIGLAFVPAVVGLTLSFWLVIVSAIQTNPSSNQTNTNSCTTTKLEWEWCEIIGIMWSPENKIIRKISKETTSDKDGILYKNTENIVHFWGITFTFKGRITGGFDMSENEAANISSTTSIISSAGWIFWTIIVDLIALIFIWASFMAAKNVSKAVKAAIDPFEKMGQKIGELGMSLPKYTPLPLPGGSVAGMQKTVNMWGDVLEHMNKERLEQDPTYKRLKAMSWQSANASSIATTKQVLSDTTASKDAVFSNISKYNAQDNAELVKIFKDQKTDMDRILNRMSWSTEGTVANKIYDKIKKGENTTAIENLQLQALMGGATWNTMDHYKTPDSLISFINWRVQNGTNWTNSTTNNITAVNVAWKTDGSVGLKIGNVTISAKADGTGIENGEIAKIVAANKGKWTKTDFEGMFDGSVSEELKKELIKKLEDQESFFNRPAS